MSETTQASDGIYPELIGFRFLDRKYRPPQFPNACPACGARRNDDPETQAEAWRYGRCTTETRRIGDHGDGWWASYECGGAYTPKPQSQNHTEYFKGSCPKVTGRLPTYY